MKKQIGKQSVCYSRGRTGRLLMAVLFPLIMTIAVGCTLAPKVVPQYDFLAFQDKPEYRKRFVGVWKTEGAGSSYWTVEFRSDGTGATVYYFGMGDEEPTPRSTVDFIYRVSDSQIALYYTKGAFNGYRANCADYTFEDNSLNFSNWFGRGFYSAYQKSDKAASAAKGELPTEEEIAAAITAAGGEQPKEAPAVVRLAEEIKDISGFEDDDPAKFMLSVTYSGANSEYREEGGAIADWKLTEQHSLSLNMGFNVFKYLNLGIDFGIKDFNVAGKNVEFTDIINLGGKIGFKWASITIDYRFNNGYLTFLSDNEEKKEAVEKIKNDPIAGTQPYLNYGKQLNRIESRTVALMFSTFNWLNLGLMWTNMTGAAVIKDRYLDPHLQIDTFGLRAYLRIDHFTLHDWDVVEELPKEGDYFFGIILDTYFDLGFGFCTVSPEVEAAYKNDPEMKKDVGGLAVSTATRSMIGVQIGKYFSKNRYWDIISAGLDINGGGAGADGMRLDAVVIGAFVRMGIRY